MARGWQPPPLLQTDAGALECAVDRVDGRVQHSGHLTRAEAEDVAQDQHRELAGRQQLKGGHEGQRDGLGLLIASLRSWRHADRVTEEIVGERLEPDDFAHPGRLGCLNPGHVPLPGPRACPRLAVH